jgi:hypothetical protein
MANTTNYNWETPDDTDLVKDGAAAIRTLGSSIDTTTKNLNPQTTTGALAYRSATANVNTALPIGTAGQVLTVASGVPSWASPSDQTPLTTKGDVFTFSTVDARLGVGANGTVLTADSAETTGLKWAAPAGGGKVLQVVQGTYSTATSITSTSMTDTGLSLAITPSSASSKVLVFATIPTMITRDTSNAGAGAQIVRTSTAVHTVSGTDKNSFSFLQFGSGALARLISNATLMYLDSPATTSSTTYKIQMQIGDASSSQSVTAQINSQPSVIILMEIGA